MRQMTKTPIPKKWKNLAGMQTSKYIDKAT
ncbi:MAG: hypothetical protein ACI8RD_006347, partial [Bacillariaceae sp.]